MQLFYKLAAMKGKLFTYQMPGKDAVEVKVLNFWTVKDGFMLETDKPESLKVTQSNYKEILSRFAGVENNVPVEINDAPQLPVKRQGKTIAEEVRAALPDLKSTIMDSINKIKENKEYIPQANAINSTINTLLEMAKFEIKMKREF